MTSENAAPAEMPGVEEIADLLQVLSPIGPRCRSVAARILALFAPILAEKERQFQAQVEGHRHTAAEATVYRQERNNAIRRALAAEAALAAERERCALIAERFMAAGGLVDGQFYAGPNTPRAIAAAIRAEG